MVFVNIKVLKIENNPVEIRLSSLYPRLGELEIGVNLFFITGFTGILLGILGPHLKSPVNGDPLGCHCQLYYSIV